MTTFPGGNTLPVFLVVFTDKYSLAICPSIVGDNLVSNVKNNRYIQIMEFKAFQGFSRLFKAFQGFSRLFKAFQGFSRLFKAISRKDPRLFYR